MKKKILVAGLACVLSLGCVFGATACSDNGGGGAKGTEVTAEQWTAAFEELYNSDNITINMIINGYGYMGGEFLEDMQLVHFNINEKAYCTSSIIFTNTYGDYVNGCCYMINGEDVIYYVEAEINDDSKIIKDWVIEELNQSIEDARLMIYYTPFFNIEYNFDNGEAALIKDLYSIFEFKDGTYSAILNNEEMEIETSIRFDGEKIIYCKFDMEAVSGNSCEFEFSDYGTTTVTLPADVQKALDDYIAARA